MYEGECANMAKKKIRSRQTSGYRSDTAGYSPRQIQYQYLPQCTVILKITYWIFKKLKTSQKTSSSCNEDRLKNYPATMI